MARFHRKRSDTACTYGRPLRIINGAVFQAMTFAAAVLAVSLLFSIPAQARDEPVIVAFGDSLSAGYGLADAESFPVQLERALQESGLSATVVNSGVSGDTTAGGRARLAWSIPPEADLVILELGANDGLRGIDPAETEANLDAMLAALAARDTKVLFAGMLAPPNLGRDYGAAFNAVFPRLAEKYNVAFYPFFLDGVAADPTLNQRDGIHPNAEGVARIVDRITPYVLTALGRSASGSQ
jgi:acyl-CoA thioesterase-1